MSLSRRETLSLAGAVLLAVVGLLLPVIPQPQAYHHFADTRAWLGIPNAANVLSNLPFIAVGLLGLVRVRRAAPVPGAAARLSLYWAFTGFLLTGIGSAWYHAAPDDPRLVWDRLPMTLAFAGVLGLLFAMRISERGGKVALTVMLVAGAASILYWHLTGDLSAYALVQFGGLAMVLAILFATANPDDPIHWWWLLVWYLLAKALEASDVLLWNGTNGMVSGHSLKHIAAAASGWVVARALLSGPGPAAEADRASQVR